MCRERRAFSLVEILLAVAILGLTIVPIFGAFTTGTLATQQVVNATRALALASETLEQLRARPFSEVAALPGSQALEGLPRPFSGELERTDISPGELVRVTVRLRWKPTERLEEKLELATFYLDPEAR